MKILITGIHIDDCECGVGGTAAMLAQRGHEVLILNIKPYRRNGARSDEADAQSMKAAEVLGAKKIILDYDFSESNFYRNNPRTVRLTENVIRDFKPDILFMMHPHDNHLEHVECAKTVREAVFAAAVDGVCPNEIYSYESGQYQTMCYFVPDFQIKIDSAADIKRDCTAVFNVTGASGNYLWETCVRCMKFRSGSESLVECIKISKYPKGSNDFFLRTLLNDAFSWTGTNMYFPQTGMMWS